MKPNIKKLLILNAPYLLFVWLFMKIGEAFRLSPGADLSGKLLHIMEGVTAAFENPMPSLNGQDFLIGVAGAVILRLAVYMKGKNAKKYRKGVEYGSARWGNAKDIEPYIDPDFYNNVLLTQTERLTMRHPVIGETVQFNDNRISLYAGQEGKCAITGEQLEVIHCICYRKSNECKNGRDSYRNLLLLSPAGYEFISTTDSIKFATLTKKYELNKAQITKVNKLRVTAGLAEMSM